MSTVSIYYNGSGIYPTPILSQGLEFFDYPARYGSVNKISLKGMITGGTSTGIVNSITQIFAQQFGTLNVYENTLPSATQIYSFSGIIVDDISFNQSHFYPDTIEQYTVNLRTFNVPSGVQDPTNTYEFIQNVDGTVTVNHRIAAASIRNNNSALNNAIAFVQMFTGKDPFANCAPVFVPSGSGILLSLQENIDRLNGTYSVNEVYSYNTGIFTPYTKVVTFTINNVITEEYQTIDYNVHFQGSPVFNNISQLDTAVNSLNIINDIGNLGINTSFLVQNSSEVIRNSGECSVEIKVSFLSGVSAMDLQGFFDYNVTLDKDLVLPKETWKLDGEFICRGPLAYRYQQLNSFKATNGTNWRNYLTNLISGSPVFTLFHTTGNLMETNPVMDISENTGLAIFKAGVTWEDGADPIGIADPKYEVQITPSHWDFDLLPSATIEGQYIVQDLQMATQAKMNFTLQGQSQYPYQYLNILSGYLPQLQAIYVESGFLINQNYSTGIADLSVVNGWIGSSNIDTGILAIKVIGSQSLSISRSSGFLFGL